MQCVKCKLRVRCTFIETFLNLVSKRHYEKVKHAQRFFLTSVFSRRLSREMARELVSATSLHNEIIMFSATTFLKSRAFVRTRKLNLQLSNATARHLLCMQLYVHTMPGGSEVSRVSANNSFDQLVPTRGTVMLKRFHQRTIFEQVIESYFIIQLFNNFRSIKDSTTFAVKVSIIK